MPTMSNERANSALDDIISARLPGANEVTRLVLKMMTMDVLYAHARKQFAEEYPQLDPVFMAWSVELAARTQAFMNYADMTKKKQRELGDLAKAIAQEVMQLFASRVNMPTTQ